MIELIVSNFGAFVSAIGAAVVVIIGAFYRGKSTGKQREQQERAAELNKQAVDAWHKLNEVKDETASKDDNAIVDSLKSDWVRKPKN